MRRYRFLKRKWLTPISFFFNQVKEKVKLKNFAQRGFRKKYKASLKQKNKKNQKSAQYFKYLVLLSLFVGFYFYRQFFLEVAVSVPDKGGIYQESTIGKIINLNPFSLYNSELDRDLQQLIFAGLLQYNPKTERIESGLAELKVKEDGKTYQLTLKDSAKFSDGTPVQVEDILFTYESILQHPNFNHTALKEAFEYTEISVIDAKSVAFTIPEKNVFFAQLLTTPILPRSYFENFFLEELNDPDYPFNQNPIGAGPYKLKNIVPEADGSFRIFLEKNPFYYGKEPFIQQFIFQVYEDESRLIASQNWPTAFSKISVTKAPKLLENLFDEYEKNEFLLPKFTGVFFNLDRNIVRNRNFRNALFNSFDREKLQEEGWESIAGSFFFQEISSIPPQAHYSESRALLRDSGFPYNRSLKQRTYGKNGPPIKLKMITTISPPIYSRMAQSIIRIWEKELSLDIDLEVLEVKAFREKLKNRDYDMVLFGQNFSQNSEMLSLWHSSQTNKLNLSNLTREDVDLLIQEIRFSGTQSDFLALNEKLEYLTPGVIFTTPKYNFLVSKKLQGFHENFGKIKKHSQRFFGIENWYFREKRDWSPRMKKNRFKYFWKWIWEKKETKKNDQKNNQSTAPKPLS